MCMCMCMCICVCLCVCVYIYMYMCVYICVCVCDKRLSKLILGYICQPPTSIVPVCSDPRSIDVIELI